MADYSKRSSGKRFGAGSRPAFGARAGKPRYEKKSWDERPNGPSTFHKATCTQCAASCEVPFKPVSGKPVFCRDCFVKTGDTERGRAGDKFAKREYTPRSYTRPTPPTNDSEVLKQLEMLNTKLERLIRAVEASATSHARKEE